MGLLVFTAPGVQAQVLALGDGEIVAANYRAGDHWVVRVNPQTGVIRRMGRFDFPTDVAISPDGFLYVSELGGLVKRVNLTNGVVTVVNPNTTVSQVWGLALGPEGDLYITTSSGDRIIRLDPATGAETLVAQAGQLSTPTGIDFLDSNHLVVASRGNNSVVSVSLPDQSQTVLAQGVNGVDQPWGIAVFDGNIYVGAHDSKLLLRITGSTVTNILPSWSPSLGGGPFGIGTDASGNIVIGVSGGVAGPFALEQRNPQGEPLPAFSGKYIGEITGVEVSRISVAAENQVNTPPSLAAVGDLVTDEGVAMAFSVEGTDPDWPLQELTYTLAGNVPTGAAMSPEGVFTWRPAEAQGPSTNLFTLVVSDDGTPSLSATKTFSVVVQEVNTPPSVTPAGERRVVLGTALSFKIEATDADLPAQRLTFNLEPGAPLGAEISPGADFTWTPGPIPGPGVYTVGVIVTDDGDPRMSVTNQFRITVQDVNVPPVISLITNCVVDEETPLRLQIVAVDSNLPPQHLTFSLGPNGPAGAVISAAGLFTWVPAEAQGPGTNIVEVRVTDDGFPPLSATNFFTVVVHEVNRSPAIDPIASQVVNQGGHLALRVTGKDPDLPVQNLSFSLASGAPVGASITAAGDFVWTVDPAQPAGSHLITVVLTDDGIPPLSSSRNFTVETRGGVTLNEGDIIVADYGDNSVLRINAQTGVAESLGTFPGPTDVALTTNGVLYVGEQQGTIERLDLHTGAVSIVNSNTPLSDVRGITVGPFGLLFVACAGDDSIYALDPEAGTAELVTQGGLISSPFGIAMLDQEHLIVSSFQNNRIVGLALSDLSQYLIAEGNGINQPWGLAAEAGRITFVSYGSSTVQTIVGGVVTNLALLDGPACGIAFGADGSFFVSANGPNPKIVSFDSTGMALTNRQTGLKGTCMGVEVVPMLQAPIWPILQWSENPAGPFVDETGVAVDTSSKTLATARRGSACFYRLRFSTPTRIIGSHFSGEQLILSYE